jgi:polyhydroxyalkanoate synthesis regulator protein
MPGYEAMRVQQEMFMKAMTGSIGGTWPTPEGEATDAKPVEELDEIKTQLADLQAKLSKISKK